MNIIESLDLKPFIVKSVTDVFSMMLSMEAEPIDAENAEVSEGKKMVGSVSFAGEATGVIAVHLTFDFACTIAANMLGVEEDEIEWPEEVVDVIGEMANMIGGNLKSKLNDADIDCALSIPTITHGEGFTIDSMSRASHEQLYFRHNQSVLMVDVYIKTEDGQ
jgi:chemotaxis protein CheX